jgi:hypothetical protein
MEEEMGVKDTTGMPDSTGTNAAGNPRVAEGRRGPSWKGWVLSILAAILLSVTATLLLGGSGAFRSDRQLTTEAGGYGAGRSCCPPADIGR